MNFDHSGHIEEAFSVSGVNATTDTSLTPEDVESLIASFPKTRFYGSKRRLLGWIYQAVKDLPFNTVLDAFGGTASVSLLFKKIGKTVSYHDGMLFNTIAAQALLADKFPFADIGEAYSFIDRITPIRGFISETFAGMYYTDEENCWLDGAALAIDQLADKTQRCVYLYCLFQACLKKRPFNLFHRANLNLRLNRNVTRTFGNSTTWERTFPDLMKASLPDVVRVASSDDQSVTILSHGDVGRLEGGYDLVYLDPPYVNKSRTTDDYLKRYHFLEGLSDYTNWGRKIDLTSKIKSIQPCSYIHDWQYKQVFKERLFKLINSHRKSIVVLSYLASAYPTEEDIEDCFNNNFQCVRVIKKEFCHALAKDKKVELLFIGSNP